MQLKRSDGSTGHRLRLLTTVVVSLVIVGAFSVACRPADPPRSSGQTTVGPAPVPAVSAADQNRIDVYELVIRRVCGPDDTGVGKLPKRVIYLIRATDDRAGDPSLASTQTVMLSAAVQDALTRRLANLHVPVKWVNSFGDVKLDAPKGQPRGGGAIVTLGNVIPRGDGSVQVAASIYFSGTGAGGRTYLLKRGRDGWTIFGTTGGAWIS